MNSDLEIPYDRVTYKDGQRFTARDMDDDRRREAWLRRLHTCYQHDTWGIALGLDVVKTGDEDTDILLKPGFAVDNLGQDILLVETIQLTVPLVAGPESYVLTLSYQDDTAFRDRIEFKDVCLGTGLNPRLERPVLKWRRPDDVRFGPHVPVVQVVIENGVIQGELDKRVRRNARPLVRPHMGSGKTERGRSGWRRWTDANGVRLGLELAVDTSGAGFTKVPLYFATVHRDVAVETGNFAGGNIQKNDQFLDGQRFVSDVRQDGFTYRILHTTGDIPNADVAEGREWFLSWYGLEPVTGCEPESFPFFAYFITGFRVLPFFQMHFSTDGA